MKVIIITAAIIFLGHQVLCSLAGGVMSALNEQRLTGRVREDRRWQSRRINTNSLSVLLTYPVPFAVAYFTGAFTAGSIQWLSLLIALFSGLILYRVVHRFFYLMHSK